MDIEEHKKRIAEYETRLTELRKMLEQIQNNGNAVAGAIAENEYWLRREQEKEIGEAISLPDQNP